MTPQSPSRTAARGGTPQTSMAPALGVRRPARRNSTVVFPHPDGPITETNSPGRTERVKFVTASRTRSGAGRPKRPAGRATSYVLYTPSIRIKGAGAAVADGAPLPGPRPDTLMALHHSG